MLFGTFLKDFDVNLYKQYRLESFKSNVKPVVEELKINIPVTKKYIPDIFSSLPLVRALDKTHPVYIFCENRKLPIDTFDFYYAENFIDWTRGNTDKFKVWRGKDHPRIVIPWFDRTGKIIGYSARDVSNKQEQKYYRIFVDDTVKEKFFGLQNLNDSEQIFVLEGELDSLMIPNAIAVSNGKLHSYLNKDAIYIPDSDSRNSHICKGISDMINLGLKVCLLPTKLPGKDLNELRQHDLTSSDLLDIIVHNTFQGLEARLKFNKWKSV